MTASATVHSRPPKRAHAEAAPDRLIATSHMLTAKGSVPQQRTRAVAAPSRHVGLTPQPLTAMWASGSGASGGNGCDGGGLPGGDPGGGGDGDGGGGDGDGGGGEETVPPPQALMHVKEAWLQPTRFAGPHAHSQYPDQPLIIVALQL